MAWAKARRKRRRIGARASLRAGRESTRPPGQRFAAERGPPNRGACHANRRACREGPCRPQRRHGAGGDGDGLPGAGISGLTRRAAACAELAEACDVDGLALFECVGDGRYDGVDRGGGIGPKQQRAGPNAHTELRADHRFLTVCVRAAMFNDARGHVEGLRNDEPSMAKPVPKRVADTAHRRGYRLHEVDVSTYLVDVLQRISVHPANRPIELTQRMWKSLSADSPLRSDLGTHHHGPPSH